MTAKLKPIDVQIADYLRYCSETRGMSHYTMMAKKGALRRLRIETGLTDLRTFTNKQFDEFIGQLKSTDLQPQSINCISKHILAMCRYYREIGVELTLKLPLIRRLPENQPHRRFYSIEQINRVLKDADDTVGLMIRICFDAGLRITELTNLRKSQISGRRINFVGKGHKYRESYITKHTHRLLKRYIKEHKIVDYLWIGDYDNHLSSCTVRRMLEQQFKEAGFEDFYPHALRHSFATDLQRQGASPEEIQLMMGHSNVAITQRYLHGFDGKLGDLFNKYRH